MVFCAKRVPDLDEVHFGIRAYAPSKLGRATTRNILLFFFTLLLPLFPFLLAPALAQKQENYFQIRYFAYFPSQIASTSWADRITLDAGLGWNIPLEANKTVRINFGIANTNLINQAIKLEGNADFGYALVQYEGGIGSQLGARKNSLTSLVAYTLPRSPDPQAVQYLSNVNLVYMYQTDSGQSGYSLNFADFSLRGAFAQGWNWGAGYGLTLTSLNAQPLTTRAQQGKFELRGNLSPLEFASATIVRASDDGSKQSTTLDQRIEARLKLGDFEEIGAIYHLATQPGGAAPQDDQTLSFNTSSFKPFSFSANLGRRSPDVVNWGLGGSFQDGGFGAGVEYAGTGGSVRDHIFNSNLRYREREWGIGLGLSSGLSHEPTSGFWFGRVGLRLDGNYKIAPWNFSVRTSLDYRGNNTNQNPWSSSLDLKGGYTGNDLRLDLGLNFTLRQNNLSGKANLQTLFSLSHSISLNLSLEYLSLLTPVAAQQLGVSLGLRYGF